MTTSGRKGADIVAEFLADQGVKHVFGIIGSGNAHLFDSIARRGYTEIVCTHHEQAAVMAMATYYRVTGKISAALVTTGAGSTNAVTGVVSAWADSIPGLILSGNENSKHTSPANTLRMWGIQGYDSVRMVEAVTKYAARVMHADAIGPELARAYHVAGTGRPGPVWLDIPMNVQAAPVSMRQASDGIDAQAAAVAVAPKSASVAPECVASGVSELGSLSKDVARVLERLRASQRPLVWLGHGIRLAGAQAAIAPLLEQLGVPALVSWAGIDMIDSNHPNVFGRAGVYGQRAANFILQNCDFLLTIGTRMAVPQIGYDVSELARDAVIASVDIDPGELAKLGDRLALRICADAGAFIAELARQAPPAATPARHGEWLKTCEDYRERFPWIGPEHADHDGFMNSYRFMRELERYLKPDQHIVTDMGTALLCAHQALHIRSGQRLLTSTGLGEMGFGIAGAIGASFARDRGEVLCLNCDGGMMMNLQELQTIDHHRLPIKIIVFNNDGYLMIKHTQKALFDGHYSGTDRSSGVSCPDYSKVAAAFNMPAYQIRAWDDMKRVLPLVQAEAGPVICEVFMHPEQPFVPKLGLSPQRDGRIVSPPLEDLKPLLSREEMRRNMIIGMHAKSEQISD